MIEIEEELRLWGATVHFKATSDDHFVGELVMEPGFAVTPHIHRTHEELFYVLDGEVEFLVGDDVVRARSGSFIPVPVGTVHDFRNPGPGEARLLGITTPGGGHTYFREVASHVENGTLTLDIVRELRMRWDTESVDLRW